MDWIIVENTINDSNVKIFALSTCIWCKKTKQLMNNNDITYQYLDVDTLNAEEKEAAVKEMKKHITNISFPLVIINDEVSIKGFQEDEIRRALNV